MSWRIRVAPPQLAGCIQPHDGTWIYVDERQDEYDEIARTFGGTTVLVAPARFQAEAVRLLPLFIPWADSQIAAEDELAWLLTPFHRNPFASNLFLHLVWLHLVAGLEGDGELVVFTRSAGFSATLRGICRERGWSFASCSRTLFFRQRARTVVRACAKLAYDALRALTGILAARWFLGPKHLDALRDVEVLVDAYLHPDSLKPDGSFCDRQLPGLVEWCRANGCRVAVYPFPVRIPLKGLPGLFRSMKGAKVPMLPFELLLRIRDVVCAAALCLRHACRRDGRFRFDGIEVSPLVTADRFEAASVGMLPALLRVAPRRLATAGIRPRRLLDWFENQPIDRANALGFGRIDCQVVALRPYALYPMYASLYTSEIQARSGACPPQTCVGGAAMERLLRRYDGRTEYLRMPALRYGHLYRAAAAHANEETLLLLLSHSREESLGILGCALPILGSMPDLFQRVVVKPHGDFAGDRLQREVAARWPWALSVPWLQWSSSPVDELVGEARLMLSAGTSAALEAVCRGVPVILIGRRAGLEMNPLAEVDGRLWTTVYDPDELRQAILAWTPTHPLPRAARLALGEAIRADYFEPADEGAMVAFAKLLTR